jgi:hypothetical protein
MVSIGLRRKWNPLNPISRRSVNKTVPRASELRRNQGSMQVETECGLDESDCNAHFIPDEVYQMKTYPKQQDIVDHVDITEMGPSQSIDPSVFEPMRPMSRPAPPPKRFYRSFWRSLTHRIVQFKKDIALGRILVSEIPAPSHVVDVGSCPA